jgi:adenylate cyclase
MLVNGSTATEGLSGNGKGVLAAALCGLWHFSKINAEDNAVAQQYFKQALDIDPNFAAGYKGPAWAQMHAAGVLATRTLAEGHGSAEDLARRAVALDPSDAEARSTLAEAMLWSRGDYEGALTEAERARGMSPNLAFAHAILGAALIFSGNPRDGLAALQISLRLDPQNADLPSRLNLMACGLYLSRRYEAVVEVVRQVARSNPEYPLSYRWLAAALGQPGRTVEAKEALEKAITISPATFDMYVRQRVPWHRPEDYAHTLEGLRKAGWKE